MKLLERFLILFDPNKTTDTTATTGNDLSVEMKTFYSQYLIKLAGPQLVHDQFAQQEDIPRNNGKTVEFRKFAPLPKLMTPLQEGVTPAGQKMDVTALTATVNQYGGFIEISDILDMTAYDKIMTEATEMLAQQAGKTLDSVTRDIITAGTNVLYAGTSHTARSQLVQGTDKLAVVDIRKAVRKLKLQNTPKFGQYYVGIIHPDVEYDLMDDNDWKYTTALPGADASGNYTVASYSTKVITIDDELTSAQAAALVGRVINVGTEAFTVTAATAFVDGGAGADTPATITIKETPVVNPADNDKIYPGEAGKGGANVYATMILGDKAYGTTKVDGGGLQHIAKGFGSSGTSDPLSLAA